MTAFCAICLRVGPALRPRQLVSAGPVFIICRRCDETDAETIRSRPVLHAVRRRGRSGGWQRRTYVPRDELERDLAFRILRAVQRFDWVTSMEITDALGIPGSAVDERAHNNFSVSLSRLSRNGFLRRRHILEFMEYRITNLGLARIENWERAVVEDKRSIAA